jgi:peptidoglycan/LPS O-acetylase OafA/YrhL
MALFIVLEHVRFISTGAFGVDVFFCISGFMIMFSTHENTAHFLSKRLIRILPLYYLMTLFTFVLLLVFPGMFAVTSASASSLIKSLCFIPFDIGGGILQPIVRIGWTVQCEICFYLFFLLAMKINHRLRGLIASAFIAIPVVLATLFPTASVVLSFYGDPVMLEFSFGILSYYIVRSLYGKLKEGPNRKVVLPLLIACISLLFVLLIPSKLYIVPLGFLRPLIWGLPALLIVLLFGVLDCYLVMPRPLVQLGNISFSVYLLHYYPVMFLDRAVFGFDEFSPANLLGVAFAIALTVVLASVSYVLIEQRLSTFLKKHLLR